MNPLKPRHIRLLKYSIFLLMVASGVGMVLRFVWQDLSFYRTPTEVMSERRIKGHPPSRIRLGGYVKPLSVIVDAQGIRFIVQDAHTEIPVSYKGALPQLFRDGQGVVMDGTLDADHTFQATRVLAKHDEVYTSKSRTLAGGRRK